jgi:hypothetical protein
MLISKKNRNYKPLIAIQLIATLVFGLLLLFVKGEAYNILVMFLKIVGISLLIQVLLFYIKPRLFGDKMKRYPHEN